MKIHLAGHGAASHAISRLAVAALVVLLCNGSVGAGCNKAFRSIALDQPKNDFLYDDIPLEISARIGTNYDPDTVELRVDGVDLIDALGLTPPFEDAGGSVTVGGDMFFVLFFTYTPSAGNPPRIELTVSDLDPGDHTIEVFGETFDEVPLTRLANVSRVQSFSAGPALLGPGANPGSEGPVATGSFGFLGTAALGESPVGPPLAVGGPGGEIRSGYVEAVEARIAGGTP